MVGACEDCEQNNLEDMVWLFYDFKSNFKSIKF